MELQGMRSRVILTITLLVIVLVIFGLFRLLSHDGGAGLLRSSPTEEATPLQVDNLNSLEPTETSTPGLIIYGKVIDQEGAGVAEVLIYRNYASAGGEVIATTDASGYYESDFYWIPGDEMVGVWAEKSGLAFEPEYYRWRHYAYSGLERKECNFSVSQP